MKTIIRALKSKNKKKHFERIVGGYVKAFKSISQLKDEKLLINYFLLELYKSNKWTLNQCKNYGDDFSNIYYDENFLDFFRDLTRGLDKESTNEIKFLIHRMMFLSFLNRDDMFSSKEHEVFKKQLENISSIKKENGYFLLLDKYKFIKNNMTIHNFYDDIGLSIIMPNSKIEKDIIDVGGYIGDSALILSNYTYKNVYVFEPFDEAFEELQQNIALNKKNNIHPVKMGCSSDVGVKELFFAPEGGLSISTNDPDKSLSKGACTDSVKIQTTTIDKFALDNKLDIGIIKIDAEGAEQEVLKGAIETIKTKRPILLVSIYHNINDFFFIKPWIDELGLNYKYKVIKPEATTLIEETLLICY